MTAADLFRAVAAWAYTDAHLALGHLAATAAAGDPLAADRILAALRGVDTSRPDGSADRMLPRMP